LPPAVGHSAFAVAVCFALLTPMIFTGRTFGLDWGNHLWALYAQQDAISHGGPSLYFHAGFLGVFYPHYAFYGGTLYTLGGGLSAALGGQPVVAYVVMWFAGFLMAYAGMLWLSFQIGLSGWRAHAAPLVVVTSAYLLTNTYARGSWPELMATAAIPLLLAAAISLLRADRVEAGPVIAFFVGVLLFTGSHNITMVWGTVMIALLVLAALVTLPWLREVPARNLIVLGIVGAVAIAANAWFLTPDLVYGNDTLVSGPNHALLFKGFGDPYDNPANVFFPLRRAPADSTFLKQTRAELDTQLPVLILIWMLVVGALSLRAGLLRTTGGRLAAGVTAVLAVFMGLLLVSAPWDLLPKAFTAIQFTFRLESYVLILLGVLVALLLRAMERWEPPNARFAPALTALLIFGLVAGIGQGVVQAWSTPSQQKPSGADGKGPKTTITRAELHADPHVLPRSWYAAGDYKDRSAPLKSTYAKPIFDPHEVKKDRLVASIPVPANGGELTTNVAAGPYLARIIGVRHVGRSFDGSQVVVPVAAPGAKRVTVRVEPEVSKPVLAGRLLTFAACAVVVLVLLFFLSRWIADHRRRADVAE
jgi:hypothetical protein